VLAKRSSLASSSVDAQASVLSRSPYVASILPWALRAVVEQKCRRDNRKDENQEAVPAGVLLQAKAYRERNEHQDRRGAVAHEDGLRSWEETK
jgi:hypothetical protein